MTTTRRPADDDVRQRVIHDLDTSFFLEAGAGTGKTSVLVARIIELARRGVALRRVVAITFTEKAAGELRERIRRELALAGLVDALRDLDTAQISTIHAFAATLLRERALDVGLDPNFRILDQLQTDLRFQRSWRAWLSSEAPASAQSAIRRALTLGLELRDLEATAEHMSRNRDLEPATASDNELDVSGEIEHLLSAADALVGACASAAPASLASAERLRSNIRACQDADLNSVGARLDAIDFRGSPRGQDLNRAAVREQWSALRDARDGLLTRLRDETLAEITRALGKFVAADAARRRHDGVLSYDDLLLEARDLLIQQPIARRALRERFGTILVDEFQDTDPLQAEIVLLLAARTDTANWREAEPGPGRLLLVGDPKQSIYRFRRADIDTYETVRNLFQRIAERSPESAAIERLRVNFRTRPALADWQNRSLGGVLGHVSTYPRAQARFQPSEPHRSESGGGVVTIASGAEYPRFDPAREAEGTFLAGLVAHLVEGRSELGHIWNEGASRPPSFREIAILIRTRTGISHYTSALNRAGIPFHFDSGQGFYERPEIRAAAHLLRALDDPTDEVAALAVLKSPLVAASDQELYDYVHFNPESPTRIALDPKSVPAGYEGRLGPRIAALSELRAPIRQLPLPQIVDSVIRRSGLLEAQLLSGVDGNERQANLRMLVQRAQDFADSEADSLSGFVRWLSQRQRRHLPESESPTSEADDDAVRILTIHQAKGLEFPIVILPKLFDRPFGSTRFIIDRPNRRVAYRLGLERQFTTPGIAELEYRDEAYAEAEARRMLYVAATRARDWLILTSFQPKTMSGSDTFHSFLDEAAPGWLSPGSDSTIQVLAPNRFDAVRAPLQPGVAVAHAELTRQWRKAHGEAMANGDPKTLARTPSALAADLAKLEREAPQPANGEEDDPSLQPPPDPLLIGSAIHAALEVADFDDPVTTASRSERICATYGVSTDDVLPHVERALASDLLQRARRADEVQRELPLTTVIAEQSGTTTITEGIADLVFRESERWILVDYKSDREIPPERMVGYERQIQAYAEMLQAGGVELAEAWLLLTATGESVRVSLP